MMRSFLIIAVMFLMAAQCDKKQHYPECVASLIQSIKNEPLRNPPASVYEFVHNGSTYFYIPAYCCDHYGMIYDSNCNVICSPDGGITGGGDGKCGDIKVQNEKLIWKDDRSK